MGKAVPRAYAQVASASQGILDILRARIIGFYDPVKLAANAMDASLFILIIRASLGVVNRIGAIDLGITAFMIAMKGRERCVIPILMGLFAATGTTFRMAEETLTQKVVLILAALIMVAFNLAVIL